MLPRLRIVILNWNLKDDTLACLDSLLAAGVQPGEIILVDNGSTDGSLEAFQERYAGKIQLIANPTNAGYVEGCNGGIRLALQQGAHWIMLLNNDTLVAPDFLNELASGVEAGGEAFDLYAPVIYYHARPERIWYFGDRLFPGTLITTSPWRKGLARGLPPCAPVDFVSGCCMLVRAEVFRQVGLFDPRLVMYGEEIDFIWRARQAGYRAAGVPRARMWHKVSLSAGRVPPQTRYLRTRNQALFYRRYARGLQRPLMFLFSLLRAAWKSGLALTQSQASLLPALWRGWRDGWFGPAASGDITI
jgi:GT2 family glycosyltransferase